jgi:16S rRNA (adenine1518-N6/adenine1519-N6)-dimethyltransferase
MADSDTGNNRDLRNLPWREILRELDVSPSKALGQNFLHDQKIVRRIVHVADVDETIDVLEIGPGLGILTEELVATARSVTAVELDARLADRLQAHFEGRATIIPGDILEVDLEHVLPGDPYVVVANLPYSIATAAIQRLLESPDPPQRMIVMVQREVAERMAARPPEMSILSVAVQFYSRAKIQFRIGSGAFIPRPRIESSVIRLDVHSEPPLTREHHQRFFQLVRAGFSQRRKRVDNSISAKLGVTKSTVAERITQSGLDPATRAERLDVPDWVSLYWQMKDLLDG